jgi:hypothetical protein
MGSCRRLEVLRDLDQKRLTTAIAAQLMGPVCAAVPRVSWLVKE